MKLTYVIAFSSILLLSGCGHEAKVSTETESVYKNNLEGYINEDTLISDMVSIADFDVPSDVVELKNRSSYIVLVKAIRDLGDDIVNGEVLGSRKEVEVIKGFKNTLKKGDRIIIAEPGYVLNNEYVGVDSYVKMSDGEEYTLFLNPGDDQNEYGIVGLSYGKFSKNKESEVGSFENYTYYSEIEPISFLSKEPHEVNSYEKLRSAVYAEFEQ